MYPVSEAFLQAVQGNTRKYYWTGKITTAAGAEYPLTQEDIVKGSGNNTHIGVEMCEPACIQYTSGSNFTCSDLSAARAADGVIISHREGHSRGIASNHGDPEAVFLLI